MHCGVCKLEWARRELTDGDKAWVAHDGDRAQNAVGDPLKQASKKESKSLCRQLSYGWSDEVHLGKGKEREGRVRPWGGS